MHPRAIAFDLDGTLAESKQRVSAEMGNLLGELLAKMPVAIMSGAGLPQFKTQLLPALPVDALLGNLYLFSDSAAQCYLYKDNTWHPQYDFAFTATEKEHITLAVYQALDEVGLRDVPVDVWGERLQDRDAQESLSLLGQQAPVEEKQKWHDAHDEVRKKLRDTLASYLPQFAVATGGLTTIDITRKGITKAYGVQRLSELTGVAIHDMLYVGDALEEGGNDAVVLETGIPVHPVFGPEESATLITSILHPHTA